MSAILRPLPGSRTLGYDAVLGCRFAQPQANCSHPSGVKAMVKPGSYSSSIPKEVHERLRFNQELLCVALAYHSFAQVHGKSPSGLADIEAHRESFPQVCEMIRDGTFVIRRGNKGDADFFACAPL